MDPMVVTQFMEWGSSQWSVAGHLESGTLVCALDAPIDHSNGEPSKSRPPKPSREIGASNQRVVSGEIGPRNQGPREKGRSLKVKWSDEPKEHKVKDRGRKTGAVISDRGGALICGERRQWAAERELAPVPVATVYELGTPISRSGGVCGCGRASYFWPLKKSGCSVTPGGSSLRCSRRIRRTSSIVAGWFRHVCL